MMENREYKSDVFSLIMGVPKYALQTFNVLNHTNIEDPNEVEMKRLESGISLSRRNDASFLVNAHLNFYEHQSTYNPNMPLRGLIYFVGVVKDFIKDQDLFGRKKIRIPLPHFVVFYNGTEKRPAVEHLQLSDSFVKTTDNPDLELKCVVYNINKGYNEDMIENCEALRGYMTFVDKVREFDTEEATAEDTVEQAIQYCIEHDILREFFIENREEVSKMAIIDMTWEKREPMIRRDGYEDGRLKGREEGNRQSALRMISAGKLSSEEIALYSGLSLEQVLELEKENDNFER